MSLRLIARDLYRLQQVVDRLEKALADAPCARREALERELMRARSERDMVKRMLDGRLDRRASQIMIRLATDRSHR